MFYVDSMIARNAANISNYSWSANFEVFATVRAHINLYPHANICQHFKAFCKVDILLIVTFQSIRVN